MRASIDHTDGMEAMEFGDIRPAEIPIVADALKQSGAWITDFKGDVNHYPYSGYRIERGGDGAAEITFTFGPDEA